MEKSFIKNNAGKNLLIIPLIVIFDQLTKYAFANVNFAIIKNIFHFSYSCNTGAAFSILQNMNSYLIWFSIIVLGIIIYLYPQIKKNYERIAIYLIVSGIIGNLIDRILFGCVRDFIDFRIWPVFNIADSAIVIGVMLLVLYSVKE